MPIVNNDAADAYYAALKAQLGWTPSPADDIKARDAYRAAFGALLNYLKTNTDVNPGSFNVVTAPGAVLGTGNIS